MKISNRIATQTLSSPARGTPQHAAPRLVPVSLVVALLFATLLLSSLPSCTDKEQTAEIARQRETIRQLEQRIARDRARVTAHLANEFLGEATPIEGEMSRLEITGVSAIPNPYKSDYPDCIAVFEAERLDATGTRAGSSILLAAAAFRNRKELPAAEFKVGSKVRAQLFPWESMPDSIKSIQRADDSQEFHRPMFAAIEADIDVPVTTIPTNPPDGRGPTRQDCIDTAITEIQTRLAGHSGSWEQWYADLAPVRKEAHELRPDK